MSSEILRLIDILRNAERSYGLILNQHSPRATLVEKDQALKWTDDATKALTTEIENWM